MHKKGCREMEGWEALDYSASATACKNSDYDRQQNQQQLIKAMAKKATEGGMLTNPIKMNTLIKAAGESFVLDTGGVPIEDFIFTLKNLNGNDLVTLRTNGGTFAGNSNGRETFDEATMDMFQAVKNDKLADFVVNNPERPLHP